MSEEIMSSTTDEHVTMLSILEKRVTIVPDPSTHDEMHHMRYFDKVFKIACCFIAGVVVCSYAIIFTIFS